MRKPVWYGIVVFLVALLVWPQVAWGYLVDLAGHWSGALVGALEAQGVISGDQFRRFDPDTPLTRAQMAKMFTLGLGYEDEAALLNTYSSPYPDVPVWHWGRGVIASATELGIAEGYPDGRFRPDGPVTRVELAMFLIRAAHLADRARLARLEPTPHKDDAEIPTWARGAVFVARQEGLMSGSPDGYFYPNQPVTRAEGSAVIFRLMARNGSLFHLSGTLVRYDSDQHSGVIRDALGQERSFSMSYSATYMRQGALVLPDQVRVLDQVFVVLGTGGKGTFLEARYQDLIAEHVVVQNGRFMLTLPSGEQEERTIQPGALVLLNGRSASLEAVSGAGPVYMALDQTTGTIRLVDAVKTSIEGMFAGVLDNGTMVSIITTAGQEQRYEFGPDPIVIFDFQRVGLNTLRQGDTVRLAFDEAGLLVYMEATR